MEYNQNLYGHYKKSKTQLIFGIFLLLFSISIMFALVFEIYHISSYFWLFVFLNFLFGLMFIAQGKGYIINDFLGRKSFVHINEEQIQIKTINKEKQILWKDIKKINLTFRGGYIKITTEDKPQNLIFVSNIDSEYVLQIKLIIKKIAESKNIELIESE